MASVAPLVKKGRKNRRLEQTEIINAPDYLSLVVKVRVELVRQLIPLCLCM